MHVDAVSGAYALAKSEPSSDVRSRGLCGGLKFSFRPELEQDFREHYYRSIGKSVLYVAVTGLVLNVVKIIFGLVLLNVGTQAYSARFDVVWDFYLWACPGISLWGVAIWQPVLEGGTCFAVLICWPYAYTYETRCVQHQRNLLFFFLGALLANTLFVLFLNDAPVGKCASGQWIHVLFVYIVTLRPLVQHCLVMACCFYICLLGKILASGIQCEAIADVAMVAAIVWLGLGAVIAAIERVERAHFVALKLADSSLEMLRGLVDRMLPPPMAAKLVQQWGGHVAIGEHHEHVSVLFCDLKVPSAEALPLLLDLNRLFNTMDRVVDSVPDACKIETVGGQYVVASGVPHASKNHAASMATLAIQIRAALIGEMWSTGDQVEARIGIHSGPIAAGVVGTKTPRYRLFGDSINTTARMSSHAEWGKTVVSHAFAEALGLPPRGDDGKWGTAGDTVDVTTRIHAGARLVCDGGVPVKGKGVVVVWRLEAEGEQRCGEDDEQSRTGSRGEEEADALFAVIAQKQQGLQDEGSELARSMINVAAEYEQTCATVPEQESARIVMLYNMLASRTGFESMYQCFKAPYMLPAQLVHAALVLLCTTGMFGVDALELYAVRARDEDVDLLIGVGLASIAVSALCTVVLTVLYWKHREQASSHVSLVSRRNSLLQEVAAVAVWIVFIVFLELVHAFGKGSTVPSWAYVIAGFLRAHSFHNLLTNGMALHPQPCGFLIGVGFLLVARTLSHLMYEERAAAGQLVTMVSAQCGPTEEWKPRNISQIVIILVLTTCAYLNRQLTERSAVRKLVATVHLKRRALEITSSLLPQHVIPKLEARVRRRSSAISAGSAPQPLFSLAEKHASVIILHADIVNFTSKCANATAYEVFDSISKLFNALDALCHEFELTKIETIGDAYLCSHSLTNIATPADARTMMLFASAMRDVVGNFEIAGETLQVRIGIHVGPMLGGIVGNRFPRYHLFGPHAKIAALLEQAGQPSCAVISDAFRRLLMVEDDGVSGDSRTSCEERLFTVSASTLATATASSGSVSASESGLAGSKTWRQYNSWRVQSWKALPCTAGSDGQHDVPDELGPVMLDWDHKGKPIRGMVLKRTPDVDESSFEGVDQHVIPYVTPCWMAFDIESCPTNVDRSVHDPREVNDQRGVHGSCDSRAGNSGFLRVPNGPGLLCAV